MKYLNRKFAPVFVASILLLVVGGFCGVQIAGAASMNMVGGENCGGSGNAKTGIGKNIPLGNSVAPCCVQRHDNAETIVPTVSSEKVKFSPVVAAESVAINPTIVQQKTYLSSSSPPPKAEILSSVVKME